RTLLAEASSRHRELAAKPALALLFLANSGPSSRLDAAGERLAASLRDSAATVGARVLRFPRARDAEAEQDLAILGLAEADDQAWRGVADLYVWGEYKELPADGLAFEQTPVEASLTLWDGATTPRTIPWSGTVATFPAAAEAFAASLAPALHRVSKPSDTVRTEAAELLLSQVSESERPHAAVLQSTDFRRSELGRNFQTHRLRLLETTAFLSPGDAATAWRLYEARQASQPTEPDSATLWRRYLDRSRLDARFPADPKARPNRARRISGPDRIGLLEQLLRRLPREMSADPLGMHARAVEVARRWTDEVVGAKTDGRATPAFSDERYRFFFGDNGLAHHTRHDFGTDLLRRMAEDAWPVLGPAFAANHRTNPGAAEDVALLLVTLFRPIGREDIAYRLCLSALETPAPTTPTDKRSRPAPAPRPEPDQVGPEWGAPRAETDSSLPGSPRVLAWRHETPRTYAESVQRSTMFTLSSQKQPDPVRLLGFDGHRLWLDRPPLPDSNEKERAAFSPAAFAPWSRSLDSLGPLPDANSRVVAFASSPDTLYFATEFDGLWSLGPQPGVWRCFTPAEGLPSLKLADLAWCDAGLVVLSADPATPWSLLDPSTNRWLSFNPPAPADPDAPRAPPFPPRPFAVSPQIASPRVAASGHWALVGQGPPRLRHLGDPSRPDPLDLRRERTGAEHRERLSRLMQEAREGNGPLPKSPPKDWSHQAADVLLSDGIVFWLAGEFGLVRLDPDREAGATWEKCSPVLALADAGTHLWAAFASETPEGLPDRQRPLADGRPLAKRTRVACYDKLQARWIGHYWIEDEINSLACAPGILWAAGRSLHEFDLRGILPDWRATFFPGPDPAVHAAKLADQNPFTVIARDDAAGMRALLASGVPLPTGRSGVTALHVAARLAGPEMLDLLLAAGSSPTAFDMDGFSPLALAAERGEPVLVEKLLAAGAPADAQARPHNSRRLIGPSRTRPPDAKNPIQPSAGRVEALPDGRARLHWEAPAHSADSYSLYRADDPSDSPHARMPMRHGRMQSGWSDIGATVANHIPDDARVWIDERPRPLGSTSTYTLIAEMGEDRYGPPRPSPLGTLRNPADVPPPSRLGERPPELRDPTPLQLAALAGHPEIVVRLLAAGANPSTPDSHGHGALHYAIVGEHYAIARTLLEAGADLELLAYSTTYAAPGRHPAARLSLEQGGSALHYVYEARRDRAFFQHLLAIGADPAGLAAVAARFGREDDIALLTAAEKTPYQSTYQGDMPFLAAFESGRAGLARRLREAGFAPRDPAWPDETRYHLAEKAMAAAIARRDAEMLGWLLERGADPTVYDYKDPLLLAVQSGKPELALLLVKHGAEPRRLEADLLAGIKDAAMRDALNAQPRAAILAFPWSNTSSPAQFAHPPSSRYGAATPPLRDPVAEEGLRAAAARGDSAAVQASLHAGTRIDATDDKGWSALVHALSGKHLDTARVLIDAGARLDLVTDYGSTPLVFAMDTGDRALIEEMLDLGSDPNLVTERSSTPLHIGLVQNHDLARLLLARGAHPELVFHIGGFARNVPVLFHLARLGHLDAIQLLVEHGADPRRMLWRGKWAEPPVPGLTALPFAAASNDLPTLEYFLGLGLDPAWVNAYGDNALDWALSANADRTAARLRALGLNTRAERGLPTHQH
ncbi:MAG: ankyrin repeat domain-containing protein, partial [Burkholderiales bacterium]|nr:ankyrin repeat domain-containing protein [Opitutaceae bacterium]